MSFASLTWRAAFPGQIYFSNLRVRPDSSASRSGDKHRRRPNRDCSNSWFLQRTPSIFREDGSKDFSPRVLGNTALLNFEGNYGFKDSSEGLEVSVWAASDIARLRTSMLSSVHRNQNACRLVRMGKPEMYPESSGGKICWKTSGRKVGMKRKYKIKIGVKEADTFWGVDKTGNVQ